MLCIEGGETETRGKEMMIAVENESSGVRDERVLQTKRMRVIRTELHNVEARIG
jgi:hypothetical protein